ncbi:MAG TPA: hypothetical protein PKW35_20785 [Nannocystaceae bacterium]|nr:hypothetical protein [Nannocystaceae bacterium]
MSASPLALTTFDVCGTPELERVLGVLHRLGYRRTHGRPAAPGEYAFDHGDAAPGWADWMYEFELVLLPGAPIDELFAARAHP